MFDLITASQPSTLNVQPSPLLFRGVAFDVGLQALYLAGAGVEDGEFEVVGLGQAAGQVLGRLEAVDGAGDRKSTRLNSSH